MSEQQPNPGIQPSLADLDKKPAAAVIPPITPAPVVDPPPPPPPNPVTTPSPVVPDPAKKPEDVVEPVVEGEEDTEENDDPLAFWGEVGKLRGDEVKWEFPEDIDPVTPAGVHHAMKVVVDRELELFEENLMKSDKRAYAYMLHRANGGSDDDFFAQKTEVLPDIDVLKGSVDLSSAYYKRSLTRRGLLPDQADMIIKDAVDKNKLAGLVEAQHKEDAGLQEKQLKELLELNDNNQKREQQWIQKMGTILQERIIENKGLGITIPDAKRGGFLQFVNNMVHMERETGRFFIREELSAENMSKVLEALYYMHMNGNMEDIITNRANVKNVQKFRLKTQADKTKKSSQTDPNRPANEKSGVQRPLSEL